MNVECKKTVYSEFIKGEVSAPQRGEQLCPFGINDTYIHMNFKDQDSIPPRFVGDAPQLNPRPLSRIGKEWKN